MAKRKRKNDEINENEGVQSVRNQLNESYQRGVIEDQLENNRGIHHFNNRKN